MRGAPLRRRPTERTWAAGTSQREWRIERAARLDPPSLGVSMLHVMHDVGDGRLLVRFEGSLDERATDSVLSAVALTPVAGRGDARPEQNDFHHRLRPGTAVGDAQGEGRALPRPASAP